MVNRAFTSVFGEALIESGGAGVLWSSVGSDGDTGSLMSTVRYVVV